MRILGIDPGFGILGWAIIEGELKMVACGTVETKSSNIADRLLEIHLSINEIIEKYKPDSVAIEKLFFSKNTKTALDVAKTIGVILLTIKLSKLSYHEYTPIQVKHAITGYGRATKDQMQKLITKIFNIKNAFDKDDAYDALSIAACHSFNHKAEYQARK